MAALAGAAFLFSTQDAAAGSAPDTRDHALTEAVWTAEPWRPTHYGARPFKTRHAVPELTTQRLNLEDVSLRLTPQYAAFMAERIENTEWDAPPLSGERAYYWPAREARRMPFFNHPNSDISWMRTSPDSARVDFRG